MMMIKNPIFVIGCPRSGTTFLAESIGLHSNIAHFPVETIFMPKLFKWLQKMENIDLNKKLFVKELFEKTFGEYLKDVGKKRLLEKTPENILVARELKNIFPDAKFLHIYRNPKDVVVSWRKKAKMSRPSFERSSKLWTYLVQKAFDLPFQEDTILHIKYEDLVTNGEETIMKIFAFLEEDGTQVAKKIISESFSTSVGKGRSKLDTKDLELLAQNCGELMIKLNYQ